MLVSQGTKAGTNLLEVLIHPTVDATRTLSDHITEVHEVLGIEATRELIAALRDGTWPPPEAATVLASGRALAPSAFRVIPKAGGSYRCVFLMSAAHPAYTRNSERTAAGNPAASGANGTTAGGGATALRLGSAAAVAGTCAAMAQLTLGRQRRRFHVGCFAIPSVLRHASVLGEAEPDRGTWSRPK